MQSFVIYYRKIQPLALTDEVLQARIDYLRQLYKQQTLLLCGPCGQQDETLLIIQVATQQQAIDLINDDPFIQQGVYQQYQIQTFTHAQPANDWLNPQGQQIIDSDRNIILRPLLGSDIDACMSLFQHVVHTSNASDYTPAQLAAWAPPQLDKAAWTHSLLSHISFVVSAQDAIIGFADMDQHGYLDRMYIAPDWQGQGLAKQLLAQFIKIARASNIQYLVTAASITAKAFFQAQGFILVKEQAIPLKQQVLSNFLLLKSLK